MRLIKRILLFSVILLAELNCNIADLRILTDLKNNVYLLLGDYHTANYATIYLDLLNSHLKNNNISQDEFNELKKFLFFVLQKAAFLDLKQAKQIAQFIANNPNKKEFDIYLEHWQQNYDNELAELIYNFDSITEKELPKFFASIRKNILHNLFYVPNILKYLFLVKRIDYKNIDFRHEELPLNKIEEILGAHAKDIYEKVDKFNLSPGEEASFYVQCRYFDYVAGSCLLKSRSKIKMLVAGNYHIKNLSTEFKNKHNFKEIFHLSSIFNIAQLLSKIDRIDVQLQRLQNVKFPTYKLWQEFLNLNLDLITKTQDLNLTDILENYFPEINVPIIRSKL